MHQLVDLPPATTHTGAWNSLQGRLGQIAEHRWSIFHHQIRHGQHVWLFRSLLLPNIPDIQHSQQEKNRKYENRDLQCIGPVEAATLSATLIILLAFRVNIDQPIRTATIVLLEPCSGLAVRTKCRS